jgi:EAL domain-containing protein (putative c-di-GMP-specific phosphodiesterase class I)
VLGALRTHGIPADLLRIEITEGSAVADLTRTIIQLQALRGAGIEVDLDDFGTGYSSLSMLRQLALTSVKIDKSFIDDIDTDPADALLVEGVIAAAHQLGMTVVAEGVERAEQLSALQRIGCDIVQGYYISRPVPASALEAGNQASFSDRSPRRTHEAAPMNMCARNSSSDACAGRPEWRPRACFSSGVPCPARAEAAS